MEKEAFFGSGGDHQLPPCFLNLNWEQSLDQNSQFESALSSLVSSPNSNHPPPPAAAAAADSVVIRELIGRLGSICNSGEISPTSHYQSANNSCYSTPLNSPPNLNLMPAVAVSFSGANPGFAERAARYSCFGARGIGPSKVPVMPEVENNEMTCSGGENGPEEPSVASDRKAGGTSESNGRKRKAGSVAKGKGKEATLPTKANDDDDSGEKRCKSAEPKSEEDGGDNNGVKPAEPPRLDYIHVRARRGQATDSHSLAERVRREKIGERMKFLQDLVPGCNKVTGKAVMLDEIINYVQSLQRQVEFLSMKLSTVNPRLDFNVDSLIPKDPPHSVFPIEATSAGFSYGSQSQIHYLQSLMANGMEPSVNPLEASLRRSLGMQLPNLLGCFTDASTQVGAFWEDDLQSVVQMGFGQSQDTVFSSQAFQGTLSMNHMKIEQ